MSVLKLLLWRNLYSRIHRLIVGITHVRKTSSSIAIILLDLSIHEHLRLVIESNSWFISLVTEASSAFYLHTNIAFKKYNSTVKHTLRPIIRLDRWPFKTAARMAKGVDALRVWHWWTSCVERSRLGPAVNKLIRILELLVILLGSFRTLQILLMILRWIGRVRYKHRLDRLPKALKHLVILLLLGLGLWCQGKVLRWRSDQRTSS